MIVRYILSCCSEPLYVLFSCDRVFSPVVIDVLVFITYVSKFDVQILIYHPVFVSTDPEKESIFNSTVESLSYSDLRVGTREGPYDEDVIHAY